ncbi:MAG TPA: amidohydrolase family protein, partial [Vicinamibacterales bacterium]|nr:amidohydrolase family protein [Vicinamibacterales bacterium]
QRVRLALGSGWPAAPLDPIPILRAVAARAPIADAIAAYTSGSAFAEFQDRDKGTLARGQLADLVILSDDIFAGPARLADVTVLMTVVGGKVVHQRRP